MAALNVRRLATVAAAVVWAMPWTTDGQTQVRCLVVARTGTVAIRDPVLGRREGPFLPVENCDGTRIEKGRALVYFLAEAPAPVVVAAGETVRTPAVTRGATAIPGAAGRIFDALSSMVGSVDKTQIGLSRGSTFAELAARMFPVGPLLPVPGALRVDLPRDEIGTLRRFSIARAGGTRAVVFSIDTPADRLEIPGAVLTPGLGYAWSLETDRGSTQNEFRVVTRDEASAVESGLVPSAEASTAGLAALERALGLLYRGFDFDGRETLKHLVFVRGTP
jgi:hypothetical protein